VSGSEVHPLLARREILVVPGVYPGATGGIADRLLAFDAFHEIVGTEARLREDERFRPGRES